MSYKLLKVAQNSSNLFKTSFSRLKTAKIIYNCPKISFNCSKIIEAKTYWNLWIKSTQAHETVMMPRSDFEMSSWSARHLTPFERPLIPACSMQQQSTVFSPLKYSLDWDSRRIGPLCCPTPHQTNKNSRQVYFAHWFSTRFSSLSLCFAFMFIAIVKVIWLSFEFSNLYSPASVDSQSKHIENFPQNFAQQNLYFSSQVNGKIVKIELTEMHPVQR